ncbi:EamA family transporter [Chryseobacterium sp. NRRL B-14859]|uniref:EamA family transporter n=1 Tax=Chryseobacterium sp. NRRL B-14859 TaxID=1562763 RepID=UPI0033991A05
MEKWKLLAIISMVFAGLTSVIAKAGLKNVSGDTGLAVRTTFVFLFVWSNIFIFKATKDFAYLRPKDILLLGISALTTSLSWIFYYRAMKIGEVSKVALIDKASIVITLLLSALFLNEQITWKTITGGSLIVIGLLVLTTK